LRHAGEDQQRFKADEVFQAGAILLGRVTYEIFAAFWPTAPKDEGFADRMNDIPKYVVSKTLESPSWWNSTVVSDPVKEITDLKQETRRGHLPVPQLRSPQLPHRTERDR
jgi:dihydrofolate reductase